ncbi:hypothetical protein SAMN02982996_01425 [Lonsdalea quercina]|uniref:Uncharacterized protein n=1 Tax=Lonsdalea quercina TaxID=71657 RepID=A0A1H4AGY0_9GAMM|nr:hypothetical protein SAMN02982996_01425 [Lonsdalea quercina]
MADNSYILFYQYDFSGRCFAAISQGRGGHGQDGYPMLGKTNICGAHQVPVYYFPVLVFHHP